mgnify:FL=1
MEYANYIARCIEIARRGEYYVAPNPMVGAVLVQNPSPSFPSREGEIIAEGWHEQYGGPHAEVNCFRAAEDNVRRTNVRCTKDFYKDCTLFVSLEPCSHYGKTPPCAKLIIEKGVGKVVVGMLDPNPLVAGKGVAMLRKAGIEVVVGVMEKECRELNKRFLCLHEQKRPYVILKWAQTADGFVDKRRENSKFLAHKGHDYFKILSPQGARLFQNSKLHLQGALAISTAETKKLVHKMRAENMAIMVGTNTVLMDNPRLLTTHWEGRNPIRVTVDRSGKIPMKSKIFASTGSDYPGIDPVIVYREKTDWNFILDDLAGRGIHSILVEGGPTLLRSILASGTWDEIHVEVAPEIIIGDGVRAPEVRLPEHFEQVDGHRLYTIFNE